jgi:hypothetical protein
MQFFWMKPTLQDLESWQLWAEEVPFGYERNITLESEEK